MGRIAEAFVRAREQERAALIIYLCAGDPDLDSTEALVLAAAEAGADAIELGVPFSDPAADGPAIQRASERALAGGATLSKVLALVTRVRARSAVPILLFGYYNPILAYGEARFARDAAAAGADGALVVDLPPEEAAPLRDALIGEGLDFVPLVAPTSGEARQRLAAEAATAFLYYVSMTGVTGAATTDLAASARQASALAAAHGLPVALGFGVQTAQDVRDVGAHADGVVVGSAIVRVIEAAADRAEALAAVRELVAELASGTRRDS
ncbi:MAG: tryptophan synthase subunit alpha [Myxococcales bacterium]|nr:tryptophan synthase subunit alpha [Myxococcales bacterium]